MSHNFLICAVQELHWDEYILHDFNISFSSIRTLFTYYSVILILDPSISISKQLKINEYASSCIIQLLENTLIRIIFLYLPTGHKKHKKGKISFSTSSTHQMTFPYSFWEISTPVITIIYFVEVTSTK